MRMQDRGFPVGLDTLRKEMNLRGRIKELVVIDADEVDATSKVLPRPDNPREARGLVNAAEVGVAGEFCLVP